MINGNLEQFLDTGWYSESTLFYNGFIYWLEADGNRFFINKWRGEIDELFYCHEYRINDRKVDFSNVLEIVGDDLEDIKHTFLESTVFDEKTFWQIESEVIWSEESTPIVIKDLSVNRV